ncbi:hypothetical protein FRX31_018347, partial [Thalictrum thalictroides]
LMTIDTVITQTIKDTENLKLKINIVAADDYCKIMVALAKSYIELVYGIDAQHRFPESKMVRPLVCLTPNCCTASGPLANNMEGEGSKNHHHLKLTHPQQFIFRVRHRLQGAYQDTLHTEKETLELFFPIITDA